MSVGLTIESHSLDRFGERIERLYRRLDQAARSELLDVIGAEVETQTRRRIQEEKTAPDGTPWEPWSPGYAATRHGGHSLLQGEGHLLDSIGYVVGDDHVIVGTNLLYGAIHQLGGTPGMDPGPAAIPARPWLGLSEENADDLVAVVGDWIDGLLEEL